MVWGPTFSGGVVSDFYVATGDYHNKPMNHNSFVLFGLWGLTLSGGVDAD